MDKHTLITIVVTAVVTTIARGAVSAIASWLKTKIISAIASPELRLMFSKPALLFLLDGVVCIGMIFFVRSKFSGPAMATQEDLFSLFAYCIFIFFMLLASAIDGYNLRKFYAEQKT